ncbi:hypothetical protein [Ferrimonas lipolytica]|uniref:Pyrrolidone-carboxylate peptidase (N-terminal pyroglutamyl peptidase) n=1 Tax=Ferrimonas lipolytica TaxID=2724191 RepID=A0A6H1UAY8_9GAMM|nr:hypothetical protein [Ferrimonas lipolytica]QIZ75523.1 hypothetical protein HER31_00555 [Ferrimonas lipolytica]
MTAKALFALSLLTSTAFAAPMNIEEQRYTNAVTELADVTGRYQPQIEQLLGRYRADSNELTVTHKVAEDGKNLWQRAVNDVRSGHFDDRSLYWDRLAARIALKQQQPSFNMVQWQRDILLTSFEKASRGFSDVKFDPNSHVRILLTGFDPFQLDKNIGQSNPSGVAALALDGMTFQLGSKQVQIETVMIPVRFQDFDDGLIESLLTPYYRDSSVDMILTVSMGRDNFDLEHFPGRNRSAAATDNLQILTGASQTQPLPPHLNGKVLHGPEFVEFSLPYQVMQQAPGPYVINDNRNVVTTNGKVNATSLSRLDDSVSVQGSGGGYLSNEISYRAVLLGQLMGSNIPVGHIHTPRIAGYDEAAIKAIVSQLEGMIAAGAATL